MSFRCARWSSCATKSLAATEGAGPVTDGVGVFETGAGAVAPGVEEPMDPAAAPACCGAGAGVATVGACGAGAL